MNNPELSEKLAGIISNKETLSALNAASSKEELQALLRQYGVDFSAEEVDTFISAMNQVARGEGELSEDELDSVSGGAGVTAWTILTTAYSIGKEMVKVGWNLGKWAATKF